MNTIAVCDDEQAVAEHIVHSVRAQFEALGKPVAVDWYTEPKDLSMRLEKGSVYDVLLLDIDMPGMDGIELCRNFRKKEGDALIVFVSNREELVFQTFEVSPFRFVRKSHFSVELEKLCKALAVELERRAEHYLCFEEDHGDSVVSVNLQKLYYVEACRKTCQLHTSTGVIELKVQFSELIDKLTPYDFLQPHRSYLVNPCFIFRLDANDVVLDNGEKIPISRNRHAAMKEEFFRWRRIGL